MVAIKNNAKTQLVFLVVHLILRVSVVMCIDGSPCCILCSINLFTLLPVHLILRPACLTLSQSPPSLPSAITASTFHSRLKTPLSQILSSVCHSYSFRTDFTDLNLYCIKGHCFVLVSGVRVLD